MAQVMRASRKLFGQTQKSVADLLGVSQATISSMESGQLVPSAPQWFRFCSNFGLDAENSYKTGFIDHGSFVAASTSSAKGSFKVPKKYTRFEGSKVRAMRPFLKYFESQLGVEKMREYFEHVKIDPDFFAIFDNQLNLRFSLDLITCLIEYGSLGEDQVIDLANLLVLPEVHGRIHHQYILQKTTADLIRTRILNMQRYENNFSYTIVDERANSLFLSIKPTSVVKHFRYKSDAVGDFLCRYKKHYLRQFSTYLGSAPVDISERECHFHGSDRCIYEIHLGT